MLKKEPPITFSVYSCNYSSAGETSQSGSVIPRLDVNLKRPILLIELWAWDPLQGPLESFNLENKFIIECKSSWGAINKNRFRMLEGVVNAAAAGAFSKVIPTLDAILDCRSIRCFRVPEIEIHSRHRKSSGGGAALLCRRSVGRVEPSNFGISKFIGQLPIQIYKPYGM